MEVDLMELKDQRRSDRWLSDGEYSAHVVCQWVYSKVQLFRSHIQEYEQSIQMKEKELWRYQSELKALRRPFVAQDSVVTNNLLAGVNFLLALVRINDTNRVVEIGTGLLLVMACLSCFGRPDFLNLTLASMSVYCQLDESWSAARSALLSAESGRSRRIVRSNVEGKSSALETQIFKQRFVGPKLSSIHDSCECGNFSWVLD